MLAQAPLQDRVRGMPYRVPPHTCMRAACVLALAPSVRNLRNLLDHGLVGDSLPRPRLSNAAVLGVAVHADDATHLVNG